MNSSAFTTNDTRFILFSLYFQILFVDLWSLFWNMKWLLALHTADQYRDRPELGSPATSRGPAP